MAAKGDYAKQYVTNKIAEAFGSNFVGVFDKKLYVFADDGTQISIALTCPKTPVGAVAPVSEGALDFTADVMPATTKPVSNEISEEEKDKVRQLMERLGI